MSPEEISVAKTALEESKKKQWLQQRETKRLTCPLFSNRMDQKRVIYVPRAKPKDSATKHEESKVIKGSLWEKFEQRRSREEAAGKVTNASGKNSRILLALNFKTGEEEGKCLSSRSSSSTGSTTGGCETRNQSGRGEFDATVLSENSYDLWNNLI